MELPEFSKNPVLTEAHSNLESKATDVVPMSMLLSSLAFEPSGETLRVYMRRNKSVWPFLKVMGVLWATDDDFMVGQVFQYAWSGLLRCGLVSLIAFGLFIAVSDTISIPGSAVFFIFVGITVSLQAVTLLLSLFDIHNRLDKKVSCHCVLHLNDGLKSAYIVFFLSVSIASLPLYYYFTYQFEWSFLIYFVGAAAVCCLLSATMYFISTDCSVAMSLLDQLIEQEKLQLLTFEQYSLVRDEIEMCQASSLWINNSVVVVSMLDVVALFCFFYVTGFHSRIPDVLTLLATFLKELPFLIIVYWQVAQVNEKSAKLMKSLATRRWNATSSSHTDNERMAIFINAQGSPIVMSIAGMRLKRRDLAWQFGLWCVAFAVSFMKTTVVNNV